MRQTSPIARNRRTDWRFQLLVWTLVVALAVLGVLTFQERAQRAAQQPALDLAFDGDNLEQRMPPIPLASRQIFPHGDDTGSVAYAAATARFTAVSAVATGRLPKTARQKRVADAWPIFAALRASLGQPVPPEVAALAREITRDCKTPAERARALYDWLTGHITYDWKVWADIVAGAGSYSEPQDPLSVIQRGTAVCAGYAWLYDAMAASVDLDATFVIGDVRGYRGTADDDLISKYRHAWNSVSIDGTWYLLDATWGARQTGEAVADYTARSDYYFATPANQLVFDHLPESYSWQLLTDPITNDEFKALPNLKPAFFLNGLKLGSSSYSATIAATADQGSSLTLSAPADVEVVATLSTKDGALIQNNVPVQVGDDRRDVLIAPLSAGDYLLRLYAKSATNAASSYACCADFAVQVAP